MLWFDGTAPTEETKMNERTRTRIGFWLIALCVFTGLACWSLTGSVPHFSVITFVLSCIFFAEYLRTRPSRRQR